MISYQNKKSQARFLIRILYVTAGFVLLIAILSEFRETADAAVMDSICRGSIALREKTYTEISLDIPGPNPNLGSIASPRLCETSDLYLPEDKHATKEQIKKEFADKMAACWNRYGEGLIDDVFKTGNVPGQKCQACYTISLRETSNFKAGDGISSTDFLQYLFETPYKVTSDADMCKVTGGFCIDSGNINDCSNKIEADSSYILINEQSTVCKKEGQAACCYTNYECWNRGGKCSAANPNQNQYNEYTGWDCPSGMECFIKNENYYSYGEYIQRFGGPGNIIMTTHILPSETYSISFGSPSKDSCGFCTYLGTVAGLTAAGIVIVVGVVGAVPTGGLSTTLILAGVAGIGGYVAGKGVSELGVDVFQVLKERDMNTIYLTTRTQAGDNCEVV